MSNSPSEDPAEATASLDQKGAEPQNHFIQPLLSNSRPKAIVLLYGIIVSNLENVFKQEAYQARVEGARRPSLPLTSLGAKETQAISVCFSVLEQLFQTEDWNVQLIGIEELVELLPFLHWVARSVRRGNKTRIGLNRLYAVTKTLGLPHKYIYI